MISGILFIVLAWILEMPLWASICLTIWGVLRSMISVLKFTLAFFRNSDLD